MKLFVYGTLKKGFSNHYLLEDCTPIHDKVCLGGYKMYSLGGFPCIKEAETTDVVEGEVYDVPSGRWPILDRLEGVPHMYHRKSENIMFEQDSEEVEVYVWSRDVEGLPLVQDGVWSNS